VRFHRCGVFGPWLVTKEQGVQVRTTLRPAYTLLEMVLVLALIVVLAVMAYPVLESLQAGPRLAAASDLIKAKLNDCRTHAIEERRPYRFAVREGTGDFKIAPDTSEYWDDGLGSPSADPEDTSWVLEGSLPDKVTFALGDNASNNPSGDWQPLATFLADGTAKDDVEVTLRTRGAAPMKLRLRAVTGGITTASLAVPLTTP
jgi:prepilin-type N-terminal cleavage/methylation domain-containing protein